MLLFQVLFTTILISVQVRNIASLKLQNTSRIIGGRLADKDVINAFAQLYITHTSGRKEKHYTCGGSLIHRRFVLTAAHCLYNRDHNSFAKEINIAIGQRRPDPEYRNILAKSFYLHKVFDRQLLIPDIAIIELATSANGPPISLAESRQQVPSVGNRIIAAGFGKTHVSNEHGEPKHVNQVELYRDDHNICRKVKGKMFGGVIDNMRGDWICSVNKNFPHGSGTGTCHGDSGGPMFAYNGQTYVQIAVSMLTWNECGAKNSVNWGAIVHPYTRDINRVTHGTYHRHWHKYIPKGR